MAGIAKELYALIERTVEGLDYELVDVERVGHGLLRVTVDAPAAAGGVTVDDCERVSHQLTHLFAVEGVDYDRLEVSSPGVDRRLAKPRDFERFAGAQVQVQLLAPLAGRRRFRGKLLGVAGAAGHERVRLEVVPDEDASRAANAMRAKGRVRGKARRTLEELAVPPQTIEFALADLDRARVVPVLNFRSGQR
ncbi:MAG: ribosome maturation factor RimP [Burkholderiaceae bacterium]